MKRRLMKCAGVVLAMAMTVAMVAGCGNSGSKGTQTENGSKILFTYDGEKVELKTAWIYAKMLASQYESSYSTYFGDDFWTMTMSQDEDGNDITVESYVKEQAVSNIKQIIVLNNKAGDYDISLSDDEKKNCEEYAKTFAAQDEGKQILAECGATVDDMTAIYEDNAIASKVQEKMVEDTDTEVSDDEARETTITRIVFETTETSDDGTTTDLSDEKKAEVKKQAEDALAAIQGGTSIEDEATALEFTDTSETYAAGESQEGEKFEKKIAGMQDGETMTEVMECDNGYVIARLDAYTDEEATASNKESIVEERQQDAFKATYAEWTEDLEKDWDYSEDVDQEMWAELVLHNEDSTESTGAETTTTDAVEETTAEESTTAASDSTTEAE